MLHKEGRGWLIAALVVGVLFAFFPRALNRIDPGTENTDNTEIMTVIPVDTEQPEEQRRRETLRKMELLRGGGQPVYVSCTDMGSTEQEIRDAVWENLSTYWEAGLFPKPKEDLKLKLTPCMIYDIEEGEKHDLFWHVSWICNQPGHEQEGTLLMDDSSRKVFSMEYYWYYDDMESVCAPEDFAMIMDLFFENLGIRPEMPENPQEQYATYDLQSLSYEVSDGHQGKLTVTMEYNGLGLNPYIMTWIS